MKNIILFDAHPNAASILLYHNLVVEYWEVPKDAQQKKNTAHLKQEGYYSSAVGSFL